MTASDDFDLVLGEWFAASAHEAEPIGLHDGAIRRVRGSRQRPRWLSRLRSGFPAAQSRRPVRYASLLAALGALVGGAVIWSILPAGTPPPTPATVSPSALPSTSAPANPTSSASAERAESFVLPFDYTIPVGSGLARTDEVENQHLMRWAEGRNHGLTVAAAQQPAAHSSTGRFTVEGEPAEVLARLRELAGLDYGTVAPVELDGRPALATNIEDRDATDIHVVSGVEPGDRYFTLNDPCRLIVANVGGNVVFVMIWGSTAADRDAFMPTAMEFLNSIHFVEPVTERNRTFVVPFDYVVPASSELKLATGGPHRSMVSWVVGPDLPAPGHEGQYGGQQPDSGNVRGIVVASGPKPWAHGAGERFFLRTAPNDLLADLRGTAGVDLGVTSETELDGHPAVATTVFDYSATDIHVEGGIVGLPAGPFVLLSQPSRLIVADVGGATVLVVVWARSSEDLEAFMPTATEFVDSIRFTGAP